MLRITCKKFLGLAQQQQHQPRPVVQSLFRLYHERVVDHYDNPRNVGSFDKNDPTVGTGLVGAPACGDVMKLQIKVDDDGKIIDACFKTFGCGSAIASSSVGIRTTSIQILPARSQGRVLRHLQVQVLTVNTHKSPHQIKLSLQVLKLSLQVKDPTG
ncbi:Iron-sulfur cluster assembly protein 3 [Ranunculus cassubicifolius]